MDSATTPLTHTPSRSTANDAAPADRADAAWDRAVQSSPSASGPSTVQSGFDRYTRPAETPKSACEPTTERHKLTTVDGRPIRVVLHQASLAKYRLPVFAELAKRSSIDLTVSYGELPGLQNVDPKGFAARFGRVRAVSRRPSFYWQTQQFRSALLRGSEKPDVLVLPWDLHYLSLIPAMLTARSRGIGVVLWGHGFSKQDNAARTWARMRVGRLADCVVLYNARTRDFLLSHGVPSNRIFVAPNSIDQAPVQSARWDWVSDDRRLEEFRTAHRLREGPVMLFVSRLLPERRVDLMLRAMKTLADRYPSIQAVIIGGGPEEGAIRALAREMGIVQLDRHGEPLDPTQAAVKPGDPRLRVRLLGALYEEHDLAPWFLCSDLMCFPAFLGLSVLHAFGYGLPVVTSDEPSQHGPEFAAIREGVNGKTFKADDAEDLAAQLDWLLSDPERLRSASNAALTTALTEYNVPSMVDGLEAAIRFAYTRATNRRLK